MDMTARGRRILYSAMALAACNFCVFLLFCAVIGGDALNGGVEEGHYYVDDHNVKTEVPQGTWTPTRVHAISVFITHGLVFVAFLVLRITGDLRERGMGPPEDARPAGANTERGKPLNDD